ncbi:MAG: hypothetical protein HY918_01380 [Candidatus Doudnabacteria bacterium]|nr:hypothetical protein [Candidatus Doudnabacteria bacterium]
MDLNLTPKSPGLPGQNPAPSDPTQAKENEQQEGEEYLFFNVMPKNKSKENIVEPSVKIAEQVKEPNKSGEFFKKYRLYIIGVVALLILAPLVYFLIGKFGGGSGESDIKINTPPPKIKNTSTSTPLNSENTTTPQEWRDKYFTGCQDEKICGDAADPDHDGLTNIQENSLTTDPNNPDSDQDGLSDGDEVNVFGSSPSNSHTGRDRNYNDADYIKGAFDFSSDKSLSREQIAALSAKMTQFGLHTTTITTLGDILLKTYNFNGQGDSSGNATTTPASGTATSTISGFDMSVEAKQDRDTQRSSTIKNIESALVKYYTDNKAYPASANFSDMFQKVKPYLKVATNALDPINQDPFIYGYASSNNGADFTLSFFSEVANQIIKKHGADAQKDSAVEQSGIYDDQRQNDLESIRTALLLYSNKNVAGTQDYVFPSVEKYKTALVPEFISAIPKDPKTGQDYEYKVSDTFNTFTLKAALDNAPSGTSGYLCNQEDCRNY